MKKDKKIFIIIICSILSLLSLLIIFIVNTNKNNNNEQFQTTTIITEKAEKSKELFDSISNVSIKLNSEEYFDKTLLVKSVLDVEIENAVAVYDINLIDQDNKIVKVENTTMLISIPYNNDSKYNEFKVLHLDDDNSVLETLNASYQNGKVIFEVTHLSRYAIVASKNEEQITTTKKTNTTQTTTKKTNTTQTTTKKINTTQTTTKKTNITQTTTKKINTTQTTTQKQYDTTITLYIGNAETPKNYTVKAGETRVIKYYYSYFKGQSDSDAPVKINVKGNPNYTYKVVTKSGGDSFGVPTPIIYSNGTKPFYIESEKVTYLNVLYVNENNQKEHVATIMIYYVDIYLGSAPSYPISDGWTQELGINEKKSLNIYGENVNGVLCQSDNPDKLIVSNNDVKVEYYATESGMYTLTCNAKNFPSAKTVINVSVK